MFKRITKIFKQFYSSMLTSMFYPFQLDKSLCKVDDDKKKDKLKDIRYVDKKNNKF